MTDQELKEEMRQDMLLEAKQDELQDSLMRDPDVFMESDVVAEYYEAYEALKKACEEYGHNIEDII